MPKPPRLGILSLAALTPLIILLVISASSSSAATSYSLHLTRYPYLTDVVSSFATVNWATDQFLSTGSVRYGAVGSESCTAHFVAATRSAIAVNQVPEYQWSATLSLAPGKQYCYRVYQGSGPATEIDLLGSDASPAFWTQVPAGSSQPFSFAVFGDWGYVNSSGLNPYQAALMSLVANSGARFAVTTGDNSYPTGNQTNYGDLIQTGSSISGVFGPAFWKVPGSSISIFPVMGNHGLSISDALHPYLLNFPQTQAVALSGGRYVKESFCCLDGTNPGNYPSAWYAFDAGLARFYVLDVAWSEANIGTAASPYQVDYDFHWTPSSPEYQWLQADLAAHPSALKFAFWHYPLYSDDNNIPSDTYLQGSGSLEGLLHQYNVRLAFTGHTHTYQRFNANPTGLVTYVNGGGGATLTTLGPCSSLDAYAISFAPSGKACGNASPPTSADQVYHFSLVTVNGTQITVSPTNSLGQTFDVQAYDFSADAENVPPSVPPGLTASALSGTQVDLSWSATTDNTGVRGYGIYRDGTLIGTTDVSVLAYADASLIPDTSYSYAVDAFDAYGNHSSRSLSASALTPTSASYSLPPVADAYVSSASPAANYGLATTLAAQGSPDIRSYLRFNVSGTVGTVTKATLRLFAASASSPGYQVRRVTSHAWDENQLTYGNAPSLGSLVATSAAFASGEWVDADVTSLVSGNGVYDLAVTSSSATMLSFGSRDSSNAPLLLIQTDVRPPTPTATATSTATPTPTPRRTPTPTPSPTLASALISGNVGVPGATLTYTDGSLKTALADANGNYSLPVSYGWSGTVTSSKSGYAFTPASRSYASVTLNQLGQDYVAHALVMAGYRSTGAYDGWILESAESSNQGGSPNTVAPTLRLGDDSSRRQYRAILSFATGGLPDNAVITKVVLSLTQQSVTPLGTTPFAIFQGLLVDVRNGYFGTGSSLQSADFQAAASRGGLGPFNPIPAGSAYRIVLPSTAFPYINRLVANAGLTQLRLRFRLDDNNDSIANFISFYSGNYATVASRPLLTITYYLP